MTEGLWRESRLQLVPVGTRFYVLNYADLLRRQTMVNRLKSISVQGAPTATALFRRQMPSRVELIFEFYFSFFVD